MPVSTRFASVNFASLASRKICFRKSHINLAVNVVPLGSLFWWLSSTAGYVPATRPGFLRATLLATSGSFPVVATRFYPGAQENLATLPSRPFGLNERRHSNCKPLCLCSLPESRDSVRRPLVGLDGRNLRDAESYTENKLSGQSSMCFIFREMIYFTWKRGKPQSFQEV